MNKYSSYKESGVEWIGEIPMHWTSKGLRFSINVYKGKIPKNLTETKEADMLPYLSMEILRGGDPKEFSYDDDGLAVKKGDIGILWDGSNSGEIILINQDGLMSSTVSKLDIIDDNLNKAFTYYLLKYYEKDFKDNTIGMGIPHMDGNHLKFSKLVCPSLTEQKQIVAFLDDKTTKIDNLIEQKVKKIDLLKEKRKALINHVVTKGLNPDVELKDSGVEWIGEIPNKWGYGQVRRFTLEHRQGYYSDDGYTNTGHRVVRITDLKDNNTIDVNDSPSYEMSFEDRERYELRNGDFLFQRTGAHKKIGVFMSDEPSVYASYLIRFRFLDKINHQYLRFFFNSTIYQNQLNQQIHGGVNPNIHAENIKVCYITYPPLDEQRQIVDYLDEQTREIDELIQLEQQKIVLLKEYRQSLISEVVTGKVRVCEEDLSTKQINQA